MTRVLVTTCRDGGWELRFVDALICIFFWCSNPKTDFGGFQSEAPRFLESVVWRVPVFRWFN